MVEVRGCDDNLWDLLRMTILTGSDLIVVAAAEEAARAGCVEMSLLQTLRMLFWNFMEKFILVLDKWFMSYIWFNFNINLP